MRHLQDKYKPIRLSVDVCRNTIVKRVVSYLNKIAESRYDGENMRRVNQLQPETDFCQDSMIVDEAVYGGLMDVIKRIEPYYMGLESEGGGGGGEMDVQPDRLVFSSLGGTKSFMVTTTEGETLDVQPESLSFGWDGGTRTLLVRSGGGGGVDDRLFRLELEFPYNWKRQFDIVLKQRIWEYIVNHVIAEWLEKVAPESAGYYVDKARTLLMDVKGTCEMRQGRVHFGWNTTY